MARTDDVKGKGVQRLDPCGSSVAWALTQSIAGERISTKTPRGICKLKKGQTTPDPAIAESTWLDSVQSAIQYTFNNPDLLEEALENPGSGVVCVGSSNRICADGNSGLAKVGDGVLRCVTQDVAYLLKVHPSDLDTAIKAVLSVAHLAKTAERLGITKVIRPKAPPSEKQQKSLFSKFLNKTDNKKVAAEAMRAVVAAVYYDGGYLAVRAVIGTLGLVLKSGKSP